MYNSIFEQDRKFDLDKEYNKILIEIEKIQIQYYFTNLKFWDYVNKLFPKWEFRDTALTWQNYLEDIGINDIWHCDNEQSKLYVIEFICNALHLVINNFDNANNYNLREEIDVIITTIERILKKMNFQLNETSNKLFISKCDADVDSILLTNQEISNYLLAYNDLRVENNLEAKRIIIKVLADHLVRQGSKYKELDSVTEDNVFFLFNKAFIRHNDGKQIHIEDDELLRTYDDLFKLIIHLIRLKDINEINTKIKNLKQKTSNGQYYDNKNCAQNVLNAKEKVHYTLCFKGIMDFL